MKWIQRLSAILFLVTPRMALAIDLSWSTGSASLEFSTATQCTLIVRTDGIETSLPNDWRLLWTAENCQIRPIPIEAGEICPSGVALVSAIGQRKDPAEVLGHEIPVEFCTSNSGPVTSALYVLNLPEASRGKFEVVALDPSDPDSTRVLVSPTAAFNGGLSDSFPPVFLRTHTEHHSTSFVLTAVGAGLASAQDLSLAATDPSWQLPITISNQTATTLTATAQLAANVPECLAIATSDGGATIASVPADPLPPPLDPEVQCQATFIENVDPPKVIQPKDFAIIPGGWTPSGLWTFHLFYLRHNQYLNPPMSINEKNIGHAALDTLKNWIVLDTAAVKVRSGKFDSQHVWAPSIVKYGLTYYMFYTGVDDALDQRIGLATSTDLVIWTQQNNSIFDASQVFWADPHPDSVYHGQSQFRDAYVMADPDTVGHWLMYFVTVPAAYSPGMVAGFARSTGDFHIWDRALPLWPTLRPYTGPTGRVESPDMLHRNGAWWLFTTNNHDGLELPSDTVYAVSNSSPTDTSNWGPRVPLQHLVSTAEGSGFDFWHATEHLDIGDVHYLAAFNDFQFGISYTQMLPATPPLLFRSDCPSVTGIGPVANSLRPPRLLCLGPIPARSRVVFRVELPVRCHATLCIYDVRGARVRTVVDKVLPEGSTALEWDGRANDGRTAGSGIYFADLRMAGNHSCVRVPLIR